MITLSLSQETALLNYICDHGYLGSEFEKEIKEIKKKLEWDLRDD